MARTANEYTMAIGPTTATRFVTGLGIEGVRFVRPTCLLHMAQGIDRMRTDGRLSDIQAERMTRNLISQVRDLYHWLDDQGKTVARLA